MPDISTLLRYWWKHITGVVLLSLLVVGVITFLKPRQYLSVATAVPGSSYAADKGRIFNENIQGLYTALGTPDDLDKIIGTAHLDTTYLAVCGEFNLYDHYKIKEQGDPALRKAAALLKENTSVIKSEYGELKVKVWDTDKNLAPQLANAILTKLDAIHRDLQNVSNENSVKALEKSLAGIYQKADSAEANNKTTLLAEASAYEKLLSEYRVMINAKPQVLIIVEKAKPADSPDRPRRLQILIATGVLSLLFALLAAFILDRGRNRHDNAAA